MFLYRCFYREGAGIACLEGLQGLGYPSSSEVEVEVAGMEVEVEETGMERIQGLVAEVEAVDLKWQEALLWHICQVN